MDILLELIEIERTRALLLATTQPAIDAVDDYFNALVKIHDIETDDERAKAAKVFIDLLNEEGKTTTELLNIKRRALIEENEGNQEAIDNIDLLYDKLEEKEALKIFAQNFQFYGNIVNQAIGAIADGISNHFDFLISEEEEFIDKLTTSLKKIAEDEADAIDARETAALASAGFLENEQRQRLERELAEAIRIGDAITTAKATDELARLTIEENADAERLANKEKLDAALNIP